MKKLTVKKITEFKDYLLEEEKSKATVEKYERDLKAFCTWLGGRALTKACVLDYKSYLCEIYATSSVNSILSSLNSLFSYFEWFELRVKSVKVQRQIFACGENELTKGEYEKLLSEAQTKNKRLFKI